MNRGAETADIGGVGRIILLGAVAIFLFGVGALFYWSGRVFGVESFYKDASLILLFALLCAAGARAWP